MYKNPVPSLDENNPVDTKSEKPVSDTNEYEKENAVYFAFIDVLGFKKTFDDNRDNPDNFAQKYKDVFAYYFELMSEANPMRWPSAESYAGQISDSLYFYTKRADYLVDLIKIFSHFSLYAMSHDVFFRGGIAKGNLFYKEKHQVYGDSVIKAYLLEGTISKNPIVSVDEATYADIQNISQDIDFFDTFGPCSRHYIKPFFLATPQDLATITTGKLQTIDEKKIFYNIENNLKRFEYDTKNYEKYKFLLTQYEAAGIKSEIGDNITGGATL